MALLWQCPHCERDTTITDDRSSFDYHRLTVSNEQTNEIIGTLLTKEIVEGELSQDNLRTSIETTFYVCPNSECQKYTLTARLVTHHRNSEREWRRLETLKSWNLVPSSAARSFPSYIPPPILEDYEEACLCMDQSPKASATLSRRCLQGMIRDYWGIKVDSGRLYDEIEAIKEKINLSVWNAIDKVRKMGNIGAHMKQNVNEIIEVEPAEAQLLIRLIEKLLAGGYIHIGMNKIK